MIKNLPKSKGKLSMVFLNQFLQYKESKERQNSLSTTNMQKSVTSLKRLSFIGDNTSFGQLDLKEFRTRMHKLAHRASMGGDKISSLMYLDTTDHAMPGDQKDRKSPQSILDEIQKDHKLQYSELDIENCQERPVALNKMMPFVRAMKPVAKVIIEKPVRPKAPENTGSLEPNPKAKRESQKPKPVSKEVRIITEYIDYDK